jgi:hypothetical protein
MPNWKTVVATASFSKNKMERTVAGSLHEKAV